MQPNFYAEPTYNDEPFWKYVNEPPPVISGLASSDLDLLRDEVERVNAKRDYDRRQMKHIRNILDAAGMPASSQGSISKLAIASTMWRVLILAKAAIALCRERDAVRDLIVAVDGLLDYNRRSRIHWFTDAISEHFRLIEAARAEISRDDGAEPISLALIIMQDTWEWTAADGYSVKTCNYDTLIYSHKSIPLSIDFGAVAHRPGVPYLTNGPEPIELDGLTTFEALNRFVEGFHGRKVTA